MKWLPMFLIFAAVVPAGCRSHKTLANAESSVMNDTVTAIITESSEENNAKSVFTRLSSDLLGIRFSADSVTIGDIVIYAPEISTEAKGASLHKESEERKTSAASVAAQGFTASNSATNRTEDLNLESSLGPSVNDLSQVAIIFLILIITAIVVSKVLINRNNKQS